MNQRIAYTPAETCEALRIGRTKFYELLAEGQIRAVALGGRTLILQDELNRFVASLPPIALQAKWVDDAPSNSHLRTVQSTSAPRPASPSSGG